MVEGQFLQDKFTNHPPFGNQQTSRSKSYPSGWTILGISLIGAGIFIYAAVFLFGFASGLSSIRTDGGGTTVFIALIGLTVGLPIIGVGVLVVKVIVDRLTSSEDNYYSKNVER